MMEESIIRIIESVGIAGGTVYFLLFWFSKKIDRLTDAINELVKTMEKRETEIDRRFEKIERELFERRNNQ